MLFFAALGSRKKQHNFWILHNVCHMLAADVGAKSATFLFSGAALFWCGFATLDFSVPLSNFSILAISHSGSSFTHRLIQYAVWSCKKPRLHCCSYTVESLFTIEHGKGTFCILLITYRWKHLQHSAKDSSLAKSTRFWCCHGQFRIISHKRSFQILVNLLFRELVYSKTANRISFCRSDSW
jgi:hypothetical protein